LSFIYDVFFCFGDRKGGKGSSNFVIVDPGCVWVIVHQDALC